MSVNEANSGAPVGVTRAKHFAARFDDWFTAWRSRAARERGQVPTVIPYTSYGNNAWVRVLCRVLLTHADEKIDAKGAGVRGWRSFVSVPVGNVAVSVRIGDEHFIVTADRGGVVDTKVNIRLQPGKHTAILETDGSSAVEAPIFVVAPDESFGIISDVDDTVMVSALPRPLLAFWNSFVLNEHARAATPGMPVLFERLLSAHPGAPVFYLSTGAWNVAPTLKRFLSRNLYPAGVLLLTDWGPTHDRWFRSGREHKESSLRRLTEDFPNIKWILIGDDGQHDPEYYKRFAKEYPERIAAIAIRTLSASEAVLAGGRSSMEPDEVDVPWVSGNSGADLAEQLTKTGLL